MAPLESVLFRWTGQDRLSLVGEGFGRREAPPAIFVPGGGQSRNSWRSGASAAAAAGFFAIAVDQRGHGESDWAGDGDYSPNAMAGDLQALMRRLDRPAVLVGASRGGYAALLAAARSNPVASALVLVEIAPRIDQSGAAQVRSFIRSSAAGFADVEEAAELLARYQQREAGKDPQRLRRSMWRAEDGRWYWHWDPRLADGTVSDPQQMEDELEDAARRLTCPVLLIRGELSHIVRDQHAAHLKSVVPHAQIVTIPGAGHMLSGDENDPFNAAILEFMNGLEMATPGVTA